MKNRKHEDKFWKNGFFVERVDSNNKKKMKTFHMRHDEQMNFNCKKCGAKMSEHNKDWHAGLCDDCFDKQYFS